MTKAYGIRYEDLLEMDEEVFELYHYGMIIGEMKEKQQQLMIHAMGQKEAANAARELAFKINFEIGKLGIEPEVGKKPTGIETSKDIILKKTAGKKLSRKQVMAETKKYKKEMEKKNGR